MGRPKGQTLTRKEIVEAAIACLEKEGESALGVNRVARELGIRPPSLYNHVAGNDELKRLVVLEGWRRFLDTYIKQAVDIQDRRVLLQNAAHTYYRCASENPALYAIVTNYSLELEDPDFAPIIEELLAFYSRVLTPFGLNQDEMIHAARMFNSLLHGFVLAERAGLFIFPESINQSFDWMVNTLIDALEQKRKI
ncbi:WHG domain-containing protein [Aetokthonos hydrillicola Thurmond2011]|jgi:AcrR family transcriptional regulator|uniref:WHG domain-containing protein n=1 Tax=Aetokthonos hydrillicola Thurmond2011 TaxID=2712845 RepID=A0AAP5IHW2_9CYAN|nr:TetR/AcrR family transcriptional regulator [Aetokthonos hydrillicola]MBO3461708.1 TetR/AcrR family transcriptional regulator [Aetokthonos hydrillicola CCALA 1050]MBW4589986.1 WHG domain-containing protein [Aetokthonos hydrillicola CCALA 1050]MDR9900568.1 WHG domain-containing protein [Aetokthonos hydrillicola Thurmond2011]